jgi:hypothetical protein
MGFLVNKGKTMNNYQAQIQKRILAGKQQYDNKQQQIAERKAVELAALQEKANIIVVNLPGLVEKAASDGLNNVVVMQVTRQEYEGDINKNTRPSSEKLLGVSKFVFEKLSLYLDIKLVLRHGDEETSIDMVYSWT